MNWNRIVGRAVALPALVLGGGLALATLMGSVDRPLLGIEIAPDWIVAATALAASLLLAARYRQFDRWESGCVAGCRYCEAPLGFVRKGQVHHGQVLPEFRRCLDCGKATPEQWQATISD